MIVEDDLDVELSKKLKLNSRKTIRPLTEEEYRSKVNSFGKGILFVTRPDNISDKEWESITRKEWNRIEEMKGRDKSINNIAFDNYDDFVSNTKCQYFNPPKEFSLTKTVPQTDFKDYLSVLITAFYFRVIDLDKNLDEYWNYNLSDKIQKDLDVLRGGYVPPLYFFSDIHNFGRTKIQILASWEYSFLETSYVIVHFRMIHSNDVLTIKVINENLKKLDFDFDKYLNIGFVIMEKKDNVWKFSKNEMGYKGHSKIFGEMGLTVLGNRVEIEKTKYLDLIDDNKFPTWMKKYIDDE